MIINHNIAALNTYNKLSSNNATSSKALEKLSSGLRINRAGDDAAGLAISEKMRGQIRGLDQATRNAQDGISLIQTAEGALNETHSILQRMRELAVQAASDTNTNADRAEIQKEVDQLATEITRISTDTEFNTKKLLNGDIGKTFVEGASTWNTVKPADVQIVGSNVTTGTYTMDLTALGTDTNTLGVNTAATGFATATDVTVAAGTRFGSYSLSVHRIGANADLTLTGPDGRQQTIAGQALDAAGINFNQLGITLDFDTHDIDISDGAYGSITFELSNAGVNVGVSGPGVSAATGVIAAYKGENLNVGGFQFNLRWGMTAGETAGDDFIMNVTDKAVKFHIGANADQNTTLSVNNMSATALGVNALVVTTQSGANTAITTIQTAIDTVSAERSKLGAMQNRLEHTINNLTTSSENLSASESRIRDVDMAKEMMNFTKTNILSQAATAMLAQANQQPQGVLQLLK
jgi:flagellin